MDALHEFNNLLTILSQYQALEKLYSMRLAQLGPKRDYDEHRKSMYEASGRASEFIKGIQKITEDLDASNFSLIKPICGFIDEQLMKKPENGTDIMVMASISIMSLSYLQSKLEPIIKGDKTLMAQPIVSLSPEEQGLGTVVIDDGTTVGPIEISAESLRVMDATKRVNIMAAAIVENYLKEHAEEVKQDLFCLIQLNDLKCNGQLDCV